MPYSLLALCSLVQASLPDEIPTPPHTTSYLSRPLEGKSALTSPFRLVGEPAYERDKLGLQEGKEGKKHAVGPPNLRRASKRTAHQAAPAEENQPLSVPLPPSGHAQ